MTQRERPDFASLSDRQRFARVAEAHRHDDRDRALRFRQMPAEKRAELLISLMELAQEMMRGRKRVQEPRSPRAEENWQSWFEREKARSRGKTG